MSIRSSGFKLAKTSSRSAISVNGIWKVEMTDEIPHSTLSHRRGRGSLEFVPEEFFREMKSRLRRFIDEVAV